MASAKLATEQVQEYYGKVLESQKDLKTNACCSLESMPLRHREILKEIDDEILIKFYGCGSPLPPDLDGCTVLDLGCGTGRDVYLASRLVGPKGRVIGIDMTDEQLEVATRHLDPQMKRFGFYTPNVEFKKGYIEDLAAAGIEDNSVDVVISNCVINLSPDKARVFSEIFRVLKPGGEMYISDVFCDRRLSDELRSDPVLYGECLSGAMYTHDFRRLMDSLGSPDYREVSGYPITIDSDEIEEKLGMAAFRSATIRAFNLDNLEDLCEDYGQVAYYLGTIEDHPHAFTLDDHHIFEKDRPVLVCGNTAAMLQDTRYGNHFRVVGDRSVHHGEFDCSGGEGAGVSSADCC
jgi:arsenite methyltransferase